MPDFSITKPPFNEPNDFRDILATFFATEVDKAVARPWVVGRPRDRREIAMHMFIAGVAGMSAAASSRAGLGPQAAAALAEKMRKLIVESVCDAAIAADEAINGSMDRINLRTIPRGPGGEPIAAIDPDV